MAILRSYHINYVCDTHRGKRISFDFATDPEEIELRDIPENTTIKQQLATHAEITSGQVAGTVDPVTVQVLSFSQINSELGI